MEITESEVEVRKPVWGGWATAGFGFIIFIATSVVAGFIGAFFLIAMLIARPEPNLGRMMESIKDMYGLLLVITAFVSAIAGPGLTIVFIRLRNGAGIKEYLGLKRIGIKTILVVLAISAGYLILSDGITILLGKPVVTDFMTNTYNTSVWPWLIWIALIVFAPAFEEPLFRGFLFEGFRQSRLGIIGAILITAASWALLHLQYDISGIVTIFFMGILMGTVRFKTGSLWSVIIMHAFFNLVATVETVLYINGYFG